MSELPRMAHNEQGMKMGLYQRDEQNHWHIGWEWHAGMWMVEPPANYDDGETQFFFERSDAFEYVDQQLSGQKVTPPADPEFQVPDFDAYEPQPKLYADDYEPVVLPPRAAAKAEQEFSVDAEIRRAQRLAGHPLLAQELAGQQYGVVNPITTQELSPREARLQRYAERVGLR